MFGQDRQLATVTTLVSYVTISFLIVVVLGSCTSNRDKVEAKTQAERDTYSSMLDRQKRSRRVQFIASHDLSAHCANAISEGAIYIGMGIEGVHASWGSPVRLASFLPSEGAGWNRQEERLKFEEWLKNRGGRGGALGAEVRLPTCMDSLLLDRYHWDRPSPRQLPFSTQAPTMGGISCYYSLGRAVHPRPTKHVKVTFDTNCKVSSVQLPEVKFFACEVATSGAHIHRTTSMRVPDNMGPSSGMLYHDVELIGECADSTVYITRNGQYEFTE